MTTRDQINSHINSLPEPAQSEMKTLHILILKAMPRCKLWFDDGVGDGTKAAINPTIGYGLQMLKYANGTTKEFFQIGLSANKGGISVYILGIKDKAWLAKTFASSLGKASVTGYCIKFKSIRHIDTTVLADAVKKGAELTKIN